MRKKIMNVVGARPNFMKIAPLMREFGKRSSVDALLVHTGQHYDANMSETFLKGLGIPEPDFQVSIGSASHAVQTARIMIAFEEVCEEHKPDIVVVVGDVNSTIACALVAVKLGIPVAHVEAGLRSFDRTMPEEINRVLTDQVSEFLFVTEPSGLENLRREGVEEAKIRLVGNTMIDSLVHMFPIVNQSRIVEKLGLAGEPYVVITIHRPSNVDSEGDLTRILDIVERVQGRVHAVWPVHPRTRARLRRFGLESRANSMANLVTTDPLDYVSFMKLVCGASAVITDSGGIQEETTYLRIPCITMRKNTERPVTVSVGTNLLAGNDVALILDSMDRILAGEWKDGRVPELWDGKTAVRIAEILENE